MSPSIILVVNEPGVIHQVVMHTLTRACSRALLLEAHSLHDAQAPLRSFAISAVVSSDSLLDGTPVEVVRLAQMNGRSVPVLFLTLNTRMALLGVAGAHGVYAFPDGLGELVAALKHHTGAVGSATVHAVS